jgi:transcriptional regulator with XRE-family HTH domain
MGQGFDREKMRERRKALELNQTAAAERAGLASVAVWSAIETGRQPNITMETLAKIAAALECDARDLITPPEPPKRKRK